MCPERIRTARKEGETGGRPNPAGAAHECSFGTHCSKETGPGHAAGPVSLSVVAFYCAPAFAESPPAFSSTKKEPVWRGSAGDLSILEYRNIQMEHVESKSGFLGLPGAMGPLGTPRTAITTPPDPSRPPLDVPPFATEMRRTPPV